MGLAALTLVAASAVAPPPFAADTTLTGSVNGAVVRLASGVARGAVEALVRRLVKTARAAGGPGAVWFADKEQGMFWQRLGPPVDVESLRAAVRASRPLAKKLAERSAVFVGPVVYLFDTACALDAVVTGGCDEIGLRDLAAVVEAAVPPGAWQAVELRARGDGDTAWTWVRFEGVSMRRLWPGSDRAALEENCRGAPYPLPARARCAVVASFEGDGPLGRLVSLAADGRASAVREGLARGLVASGWSEDGDDFLGTGGRRLRVTARDGTHGAELVLVETP